MICCYGYYHTYIYNRYYLTRTDTYGLPAGPLLQPDTNTISQYASFTCSMEEHYLVSSVTE